MCFRNHHLTFLLLFGFLALWACAKPPDDAAITDSIKARLFTDPELKQESIGVAVAKGEATLLGNISSDDNKQQVLALVQSTPGVKNVHDLLQVKPAVTAQVTEPIEPANPIERADRHVTSASKSSLPARSAPEKKNTVPPAAASGSMQPLKTAPPTSPPPPPTPKQVVVPEGTEIQVLMIDSIDSEKNKADETFLASLYAPITVGEEVVVPKKVNVYVRLVGAQKSGKFKGKSELHLALDSLEFQGTRYPLQSSTYDEAGKSRGKQTAKRVGVGAAVGTAIGAIAGGGKGAAIGAGVGAGAGVATQVFTRGEQVRIPSETRLDFRLEAPVEITIHPGKSVKPSKGS